MTINLHLDNALKPLVIFTNLGVNFLTKVYLSTLDPDINCAQKKTDAGRFHYNVKVTSYNLSTIYLIYKVVRSLFGKESLGSSIGASLIMLLNRAVLEKTLSIKEGKSSVVTGITSVITSTLTGNETLEGISITDNSYTLICIAAAKAISKGKNSKWKENLLKIQGYPIFKSWAI